MSGLNPEINTNIAFEQPTQQAPSGSSSVLEGVSGIAGLVLGSIPRPTTEVQSKPTSSELKSNALGAFTSRLEDFRNSDMTDQAFQRAARDLGRKTISKYPEYSSEVTSILSSAYDVGAEQNTMTVTDTLASNLNEYGQTPQGITDLSRAVVLDASGSIDNEATEANFRKYYFENQAEVAALEQSNRRLTMLNNDQEAYIAESKIVVRTFTPSWTNKSQEVVTSLLSQATSSELSIQDKVKELRNQRAILNNEFIAKAQAGGIAPSVYKDQIAASLAPIDNILGAVENSLGDAELFLDAYTNAQELKVTEMFVKAMGPLGANPRVREQLIGIVANSTYRSDVITKIGPMMTQMAETGDADLSGLDVLPSLPADPSEAVDTSTESHVDPAELEKLRTRIQEDPDYFDASFDTHRVMFETSDMSSPEGRTDAYTSFVKVVALSTATTSPLGPKYLADLLSAKNIRSLAELSNSSGPEGVDFKSSFASFVSGQILKNKTIIDSASESGKWGVTKGPNGLQVTKYGNVVVPNQSNKALTTAVNNLNKLQFASSRVAGVQEPIKELIDRTFQPLDEATSEIKEFLNQAEDGDDRVDGSQGNDTLTNNTTLISLIDRKEGGGQYDTLFGFSQRGGGAFAGVDVTKMTLKEAIDFSSKRGQGSYGQWVKENNPKGDLATPMGRFQIVGTTLKETVKEMGLSLDTKFDASTQNAMFEHLANKALKGKKTPEAKRKSIRNMWDGFNYVSDGELDRAISSFESGESTMVAATDIVAKEPDVPQEVAEASTQAVTNVSPTPATQTVSEASSNPVRQSVPVPTDTQQGNVVSSARGTREGVTLAAKQEIDKLSSSTQSLLNKLGVNNEDIPKFSTEAEARKAVTSGVVGEGEVVMVNGEVMVL